MSSGVVDMKSGRSRYFGSQAVDVNPHVVVVRVVEFRAVDGVELDSDDMI
ncbi:hypothetical protein Syun_015854 [Stephania yunnanensis]|uniref:Uncharacterized protein n=1 Tax=Stephania yunnanensis TaxID=152371 RepID=A0AAP0P0T9_9MAGN